MYNIKSKYFTKCREDTTYSQKKEANIYIICSSFINFDLARSKSYFVHTGISSPFAKRNFSISVSLKVEV